MITSIRILEFGYTSNMPSEFCFDGNLHAGETFYSPFSFTLLRAEEKNVLVDCGIDLRLPHKKEKFISDHGENGHSSDEVLASIGVAAADIDAIILTHLHWDHAGGLTCFPNAHVYVQKQEMFRWIEAWSKPVSYFSLRANLDPADLKALIDCAIEGRLTLLDGDCDNVLPGIHMRSTPLVHSFVSQAILIDTPAGTYIVAGDICNRPENLTGTSEAPGFYPNVKFSIGSSYAQAEFYDKLLEWANGDVSRIIMTHDGTCRERYRTEKTSLELYCSYVLK